MNVLTDHYISFKRALIFLSKKEFSLYFIPGVVLTLLLYLLFGGLSLTNSAIGFLGEIPWIGSYIRTIVDTTFGWIYSLFIFIYQFTIITLLSPFNTSLSKKIEHFETGKEFKTDFAKFIKEFFRLIGVVTLSGLMYFGFYLVWQLLAWVLGLSFLSPVFSFILISFFTGFNSYDYALERHGVSVGKSWGFAFKHPLYMIITGGIFTVLLYIPIIGIIIAPVLLTVVGTLNYLKINEKTES